MTSLDGKVVFITGGGRGIGAEVARRLRNKGARLVLTDLDQAELAAVAAELGEDHVLTAVADVRDLPAMQAAAAKAVETLRRHRRRRGQRRHRQLRVPVAGRPGGIQTGAGRQRARRLPHRARHPAFGDRPPRLRADRLVAGRICGGPGAGAV